MALEDLKSVLGKKSKDSEMESEDTEMEDEESEESGSGDLVTAARAVKSAMAGDPKKLARALKAFIKLCNEEDY